MNRRAFIAVAAVTPLAGCGGLFGGSSVDTTLADEEVAEFTADEGSELSVSVDVQELAAPAEGEDGEEVNHERDSLTFQINHEENGPIDVWGVADSDSFDVTVESGGTHIAMVIGGTADVTIE
jgi:hypothetical protein